MSSSLFTATPDEAPALREKGFIALGPGEYWVAKSDLAHERDFIHAWRFFQNTPSPLDFPEDWLNTRKQEFIDKENGRLDPIELAEQFGAVFGMLDRGTSLTVLTGPPGAAKSTIASLWTRVARARYPDLPLVLITQEKPALQRLKDKINVDEAHVLTVTEALAPGTVWPKDAAIIIDEAGLFCTEIMADLLTHAKDSRAAKVILIGDDRQLESEAPGQPFRWLCQNGQVDVVVLNHPFRQKNPELREAVSHLYRAETAAALKLLPCHFIPAEKFLRTIRAEINNAAPDKSFVVVHGPDILMERLRVTCPGFRILSLPAAQGLAIDRVILVVGKPINSAELLVGCSRQRFYLDIIIDADVYADAENFAATLGAYPKGLMAVDLLPPEKILEVFNEA